MSPQDAEILLPILQKLPVAQQEAMIRYLYRIEGGGSIYDAGVLMQMELGATKAEAHAIVDRLMGAVRH